MIFLFYVHFPSLQLTAVPRSNPRRPHIISGRYELRFVYTCIRTKEVLTLFSRSVNVDESKNRRLYYGFLHYTTNAFRQLLCMIIDNIMSFRSYVFRGRVDKKSHLSVFRKSIHNIYFNYERCTERFASDHVLLRYHIARVNNQTYTVDAYVYIFHM